MMASAWRNEDLILESEQGDAIPDAVIIDSHDQPVMLIEFGGDYAADRISAFHDDAAMRGTPYQIW